MIEQRILDYLSTNPPNKQRTLRSIHKTLDDTTIIDVRSTLTESPLFELRPDENGYNRYWYLTETPPPHPCLHEEPSIYVLVDCDNSPNIFYSLLKEADVWSTMFLRGYSGPGYNSSKVSSIMSDCLDLSRRVSFHQAQFQAKDAADVVILFDLLEILRVNPTSSCVVVSGDKIFKAGITELRRRFPFADLQVCSDSGSTKGYIAMYL